MGHDNFEGFFSEYFFFSFFLFSVFILFYFLFLLLLFFLLAAMGHHTCPNVWGCTCGKHSIGENWSKKESSLHINVLNMEGAYFAVKIYAATLSETSVHLRLDNTATLA